MLTKPIHHSKCRLYDKARNTTELYEKELRLVELGASMVKVKRRGFTVLEYIYTGKEVNQLLSIITRAMQDETRFRLTEDLFAIRCLLKEIPNLKDVLFNSNLCTLVKEGFGKDYFLTKAIYFDKPPKSNWYVTWHQDVPINVAAKVKTEGFRSWTHKTNLISVVPPIDYLQSAYTVRIYLDDTDEKNGALKVIPKTHFSILTDTNIAHIREENESKACKIKEAECIYLNH